MSDDFCWRNKNVLVTGGLGFIGSTLAIRLTQLGARVTVLDSLIPEYGGNPVNIAGFEEQIRVNISDVRDVHALLSIWFEASSIFSIWPGRQVTSIR